MDGFILILAIILFSVFRNVMQEAKKKDPDRPPSDALTKLGNQDEARRRAEEALRRWEAKQHLPPEQEASARQPVRIPRPGEHRTDVRLEPRNRQQSAVRRGPRAIDLVDTKRDEDRTRREAYDAIRQLLAGQTQRAAPSSVPVVRDDSVPARRGEMVLDRRRETFAERGRRSGLQQRREATPASRARIKGTLSRRSSEATSKTAVPGPGPSPGRSRVPRESPAALHRLDVLPPVARGVMYAELLGRPLALREDPGPEPH